MTEAADNGFQRVLVKECVDEILRTKGTNKEGYRGIAELLKKYEEKIFDHHNRRPVIAPVPVQAPQQRVIEKEETTSPGLRYPFVSDGSFHTNYPRLQAGYNPNINPQTQYQQQQQQYQSQHQLQQNPFFQDLSRQANQVPYQPGPTFLQGDNRYYGDAQMNAKFHIPQGPQGYDPNYNNANAFMNRPMNDISNQPHLLNQQGGYAQNLGFQNPNPYQNQGYQFGLGINQPQPGDKSAYFQGQDQQRLSRNIELLGGIERTLPNMQMSLKDNEIRNIERNYHPQGQHDTGNYRLNNLLQSSIANAAQYDYQNIRSASPARGEYLNTEAQYLRGVASPQQVHYQSPNRDFATEQDLRWSGYYGNARSRDPSQERRPSSARKSAGLTSSKDLRNEKAELLSFRPSVPTTHYERDYYN